MADGTQYLIDISAQFSGDNVAGELAQIADRLSMTGSAADAFDAAIGKTKAALASAGDAAAQAAADLAEGEQRYAQLERAAVQAAKAFEKVAGKSRGFIDADLQAKAQAAAEALRGEGAALDSLRAKSEGAAAEQRKLAAALKKLEAGSRVAKQQDALAAATARGSGNLGKLAGALGQVGGPLGALGGQAAGLANSLGDVVGVLGTGPGALVAAAVAATAAVVALGVAIGAAIVKTAMWAIGLADAKRNLALTIAGLEASSERLAGLSSILPGIARSTGLATEEIAKLAEGLDAAKVSADDMPDALRALATATAGGATAKRIAEINDALKTGKKSAAELAAEIERDFGGIVAQKLLGLDKQTERLKKNLGETFGGLKIDGLLKELDRLVKLFDASTVSGQTMKFLFEKLFQPLIDAVAKSGPAFERFFLGIQIGALKIYLAIQPAVKAIKSLLGEDDSSTIDTLKAAELAGKAVAAAIATAVIGVGLLIAALALPIIAFHKLGAVAEEVFGRIYNSAASALEFIQSISLSEIGSQMMDGLASGISGAKDRVVTALTGAVNDAIAAAKKLLGIASPSKVFEGIGVNVGEGFAGGVEGETDAAKSALEGMAEPPAAKGARPDAVRAGGGSFDLSGATFNFYGVKDAEQATAMFGDMLTRVLEGDVEQLGGQPPEEPAT